MSSPPNDATDATDATDENKPQTQERQYSQGCYNLRLYVSQAQLPEMECTRFCPHLNNPEVYNATTDLFQLSPTPNYTRKLRQILHLLSEHINRKINDFTLKIPNRPIPEGHDVSYTRPSYLMVPAPSFKIEFYPPKGIYDVPTMAPWMNIPLLTAERVISLVWPKQTEDFRMMISGSNSTEWSATGDTTLYRLFFYKRFKGFDETSLQDPQCKMVVASLVPWALTPQNMDDFVRVAKMPAFSLDQAENVENPPAYNRAHKIWAMLWDECSRKNCPFFVLTVYDSWIFGVFVKGWSTALISEVIKYSDVKPTVIQWLVFWFASSMGLPGSWKTPLISRFGNPDIRHLSRVAIRDSSEDMKRNTIALQEEWLTKYHKIQDSKNQMTTQVEGVPNTWLTQFYTR